jgi:hypothetical protein
LLVKSTDLLFGFADSENLRAASWAEARSRGFTIFHGNGLGILDLFLGSAFYAVCLHAAPPFDFEQYIILPQMSIGFERKIENTPNIAHISQEMDP